MPYSRLNGHLTDSMLMHLSWPEEASERLRPDAAESIDRMAVAFFAQFHTPLRITDSYRTFAQQVAVKAKKGNGAATPGTSNHGLGLALDMASGINSDGTSTHCWFEQNAAHYGWVNPAWAQDFDPRNGNHEPWHWEYHAELDRSATDRPVPAPMPIHVPTSPVIQEDDVKDALIALYLQHLGRMPDPTGAASWLSQIATGQKTWSELEDGLQGSAESKAFAALGSEDARNAKRGAAATAAHWPF